MDRLLQLLSGDLSASERIVTAILPLVLIGVYLLGALIVYGLLRALRGPFRDGEMAQRGSSVLLGMAVRQFFAWLMYPFIAAIRFSGIPANALTTLSVLLATGAAVALGAGRFSLGGWLFLLGGLCDFFDGRIARQSGSAGPRGAALDSILDRYADGVVLLGLGWYYRDSWVALVVGALLICSFLVSYIRAKGESLGVEVKVGLMQRPERVVYLGLAVALSPIPEALYAPAAARPVHHLAVLAIVLLAATTLITVVQRFTYLLRALDTEGPRRPTLGGTDKGSLLRFSISSALATGLDFALVWMLVSYGGLSPWLATLLGCGLGGVVNFSVNRVWAIGSGGGALPSEMRRYTFVSASSALLNAGGVALMLLLPAMDYRLAWLLARGAVWLFWNYPLNRDYVFAAPDAEAATTDTEARRARPVARRDEGETVTGPLRAAETAPRGALRSVDDPHHVHG